MDLFLAVRWGAEVVALGALLAILIQDWRWRAVHWYWFPIVAISLAVSRCLLLPFWFVLTDTAVNLLFVAVQLIALRAYVRWRFSAPLLTYLGAGDILYWIVVTVFFTPAAYLLYTIGSLLGSLGMFLGLQLVRGRPIHEKVPLAGLQAGMLLVLLLASWLRPSLLPTSDEWLFDFVG